MAYIECPSCGKTALSVASRCPHCGLLFSVGIIPPAEPNRLPGRLLMAGALVALVVVVVLARKQNEPRAAALSPAPAESRPIAPAPASAVDRTPPPAAASPQGVPPQAAPPEAAPPPAAPTGEQLRRYATTWVNVRARRGPDAAPVRVLNPGEAILVDSLVGGWYRVVIGGEPIGYAYDSNLSESAP